jgi:hypothetical protein
MIVRLNKLINNNRLTFNGQHRSVSVGKKDRNWLDDMFSICHFIRIQCDDTNCKNSAADATDATHSDDGQGLNDKISGSQILENNKENTKNTCASYTQIQIIYPIQIAKIVLKKTLQLLVPDGSKNDNTLNVISDNCEVGFILNHFSGRIYPRKIMTKRLGYQIEVNSERDIQ